ncbi:MAG TPA: hypothetical protein VG943_06435 [Caulobacterales bacterium]|nr:hypothetical protein [Caulobacterales bacterium]
MLDSELQAFVAGLIRSVWALEVLLLLRRRSPAALTPDELTRELRATPTLVTTCLQQLETAGLVAGENGAWTFSPSSPRLAELAGMLEQAYLERPVAVVDAIMSKPDSRLKTFADAFRFKDKNKEKDE